ncbi:MAG: hypothetical protein Q9227_009472 [Pyrenula ochraceoflavens]
MATTTVRDRPAPLTTKSFTRFEPTSRTQVDGRSRASTIQSTASPRLGASEPNGKRHTSDVFDRRQVVDEGGSVAELESSFSRSKSLPDRFDELPIELLSFTDRFVDSLSAKTWSEPPTIDTLAELFQDFYARANTQISTHISALSSRVSRDASPAASIRSSRSTSASRSQGLVPKASTDSINTLDSRPGRDQQMLTASEVAEKRKTRKMLEVKRLALEEAVERRACEKVYPKIFRHRSTLDEVRDEKLRSKTAALDVVEISLGELGIDMGATSPKSKEEVRSWFAQARDGLAQMNTETSPLGKLQHLTTAHKSIVDALSKFHPSSSSADDILPTLIYTLITSPPEGISVTSNLLFIQRFRNANKIDGEAAYCMTNLEAAISFLENVDLASLREDELPEGPPKSSSRPPTPTSEKVGMLPRLSESSPALLSPSKTEPIPSPPSLQPPQSTTDPLMSTSASPAAPSIHQRRLSNLLQPSTKAFEAANESLRSTADSGFKNISNTLDNSFKFLFGRLQQAQAAQATAGSPTEVTMPKTLDDARRLVNHSSATPEDPSSETSSMADIPFESLPPKAEEKLLGLIGGRKAIANTTTTGRERSVDSVQSTGSNKRVSFAATGSSSNLAVAPTTTALPTSVSPSPQPNALDSMKNFGSSLNPLNHISSFGGGLRAFGASATKPPPPSLSAMPSSTTNGEREKAKEDTAAIEVINPATLEKIRLEPPLKKFVEAKSAAELRIGDVEALLREYQRLAGVFEELVEK